MLVGEVIKMIVTLEKSTTVPPLALWRKNDSVRKLQLQYFFSKILAAGGKILRPSPQRLYGHRRGNDFHGEDGGNLMFLVSRLRHARSWEILELAVESPRFNSMTSAHQLWVRLLVGITSAMITSLISWCTWTSIKAWKHFRVSGGSRCLGGWLADFTKRL